VENTWDDIKMGYRLGFCVVLLIWLCWEVITSPNMGGHIFEAPVHHIYDGIAGILLCIWFWGINLLVWQRFNIEYPAILGLEMDHMRRTPTEIITEVAMTTSVYLANLLIYYKIIRGAAGE